jgi:hypothetical protein
VRLQIVEDAAQLVQEPGPRSEIDEPRAMFASHLLLARQERHGFMVAAPACGAEYWKQHDPSEFISHGERYAHILVRFGRKRESWRERNLNRLLTCRRLHLGMRGFVYYVVFLGIAALIYDTFALDSRYFKALYFEAQQYAHHTTKQSYHLSGQSRPVQIRP